MFSALGYCILFRTLSQTLTCMLCSVSQSNPFGRYRSRLYDGNLWIWRKQCLLSELFGPVANILLPDIQLHWCVESESKSISRTWVVAASQTNSNCSTFGGGFIHQNSNSVVSGCCNGQQRPFSQSVVHAGNTFEHVQALYELRENPAYSGKGRSLPKARGTPLSTRGAWLLLTNISVFRFRLRTL